MLNIDDHVYIAGDWHANFGFVENLLENLNHFNTSRTIIHVGDLGIFGESDLDEFDDLLDEYGFNLYWVDGNHENFDLMEKYNIDDGGLRQMRSRIWHITRGTQFMVDGVRWAALGGAASIDRQYRKQGVSWWPQEYITDEDVENACMGEKVEVMITHDTPQLPVPIVLQDHSTARYWPEEDRELSYQNSKSILKVMEKIQPAKIFHGHWHMRYTEDVELSYGVVEFTGLDCDTGSLYDNVVLVDGYGNRDRLL